MSRRRKWAVLLCLVALALATPAFSQTPYLVKSFADGEFRPNGSISPISFLPAGDRLFFLTDAAAPGLESVIPKLWVSDGSAAGTQALPDLCVGSCGGRPALAAALGRVAFFAEFPAEGGEQLWRSDGTPAGTFLLQGGFRLLQDFKVWRRQLYFIAYVDPVGGGEPAEQLWRSDGTRAGTARVADLGSGTFSRATAELAVAGDRLFLLAPKPAPLNTHATLWVSDGTTAGTRPVSASAPLDARQLTAVGERMFFLAPADRGDASQLWVSDGSAAGTLLLTRFSTSTFLFALQPGRLRVYFQTTDELDGNRLWASDGTPAGTRPFAVVSPSFSFDSYYGPEEIGGRLLFFRRESWTNFTLWATPEDDPGSLEPLCPGICGSGYVTDRVRVGERLLFLASDEFAGTDLWSSDATARGTIRLKETCTGGPRIQHGPCADPGSLTLAGGAAFFKKSSPTDGSRNELWRSDGTQAGTRRFTDRPIFYDQVAAIPGVIFFAAIDDHLDSEGYGELFASDEAAAGTRQLTDLSVPSSTLFQGLPSDIASAGGLFYFLAGGRQIWRSDGSAAGTLPVPGAPYSAGGFTAVGGAIYFVSPDSRDRLQLWVADAHGARQLTPPSPVPQPAAARAVEGAEQNFFFLSGGGRRGDPIAVWRTDGTTQGTVKVFDLPPALGEQAGDPGMYLVGADFYFTNELGTHGPHETWKSDGTTAGTVKISQSCCRPPNFASFGFTRIGNTVYYIDYTYVDYTGANQSYLRQTDGTPAGTAWTELAGSLVINPTDLLAVGGFLYLFADAPVPGDRLLWRTDGTPAGTTVLATFRGGSGDAAPRSLVALGGSVAFVADDGVHGLEPWITDGTAAGTRMLADILPGTGGSRPGGLTVAAGRLFFSANDGVHGRELWQSDGTEEGTRLVEDLAPGPLSSYPFGITEVGDRLFFTADDGLIGTALWALPLTGGTECQPSATALCLSGGRFKVEAFWRDFGDASGAAQAVPLTADTGYFWFFDPDNVELVAKVLDGRPLNGHFWVFYATLSSVEVTLTLTDTQTGLTRRYYNPPHQLSSVGDTHAFGPLAGASRAGPRNVAAAAAATPAAAGRLDGESTPAPPRVPPAIPRLAGPPWADRSAAAAAAGGRCQPGASRLCLAGGRFAVEAAWTDVSGRTSSGNAVALTAGSGYFWFFGPGDAELVAKVLDGRALNGKFWFFYGALSDVGTTLTVTDTETGAVRTYIKPKGQLASVADTAAF
ncbi:MAG TPA: ELWxxDGT repeat protein [Thermoanaerobaculia bacterium]|nr:ELWxxDGT repeat protein [Thermoanaerobaculia bacterium]